MQEPTFKLNAKQLKKAYLEEIINGRINSDSHLLKVIVLSYSKGGITKEQAEELIKTFGLMELDLNNYKVCFVVAEYTTPQYTKEEILKIIFKLFNENILTKRDTLRAIILITYELKAITPKESEEALKSVNLYNYYLKQFSRFSRTFN